MTDNPDIPLMSVKVVVAMPDKQVVKELGVLKGATVSDVIEQSGIVEKCKDLVVDPNMVGIFGVKVSMDQCVEDGDRVEIYRPLIADPKEVRRQRAIRQAKASD